MWNTERSSTSRRTKAAGTQLPANHFLVLGVTRMSETKSEAATHDIILRLDQSASAAAALKRPVGGITLAEDSASLPLDMRGFIT